MNLKEIAYSHYLPEKRARRRANTCEGYESALRLHVIPRFGSTKLEDITHEEIQRWVDSFELPGAAEKAFKTLRQVVRWAITRFGVRIWDPTQGIELPRKPKREQATLTADEVATVLRGFYGHVEEPTVLLSSCLGLRPGEAYGMAWSDIDMRSGAVRVRRTLQEVKGLLYSYPPKTDRSERTVYLPAFAARRIRAIWRDRGKPSGRIIEDRKPSQVSRAIGSRSRGARSAAVQHVRQTAHMGDCGGRGWSRHRGGCDDARALVDHDHIQVLSPFTQGHMPIGPEMLREEADGSFVIPYPMIRFLAVGGHATVLER